MNVALALVAKLESFLALFILVKLHSFELCKDYMSYAVMSMEMYLERYKGG